MLEPKKIKHRKVQRGRGQWKGKATRCTQLAFGSVGLKCAETCEVTARQIEAARRAMTHAVARGGKIWIRVFPHTPVSRKAAEVPMGSGKGSLEYWATVLKAGTVIFEMDGLSVSDAQSALKLAGYKLPMKTRIVTKIIH